MPNDSRHPDYLIEPDASLPARLQQAAHSFAYPPTPELAVKEKQRVLLLAIDKQNGKYKSVTTMLRQRSSRPVQQRLKIAMVWIVALVILLAGLLWVSPVRARVVEWLRVGAVRLFMNPVPTPIEKILPTTLTGLAGETTLSKAAEQFLPQLLMPSYPPDLGEPQHVYLQRINGAGVVIFAWQRQETPQDVRLALYQIEEGDVYLKQYMENVQETSVNGNWALWIEGPYLLSTTQGQVEERRIVKGRTLVWSVGGKTYRLETDLPLEEARKIAKSLMGWKP